MTPVVSPDNPQRVKASRAPKLSQRETNTRAILAASDGWTLCRRKPDGRPYFAIASRRKPRQGERPRIYGTDLTNCTCDYRTQHSRGNDDACAHMLAVTRWYRAYRFYETRDHQLPPDVAATWEDYDTVIADRADALLTLYERITQAQREIAVVDAPEDQDVPPVRPDDDSGPDPDWWAEMGDPSRPVWLQPGDRYTPDTDPDPLFVPSTGQSAVPDWPDQEVKDSQ